MSVYCELSSDLHVWKTDSPPGQNVCSYCGEVQDAVTGEVLSAGGAW